MAVEILVGTFAAVGLICILWAVYDILLSGCPRAKECAELYFYLDGRAPEAERLLRTANRVRRFLPGLPVVFIDTGEGCGALERLAEELDIEYFVM